MPGPVLGTRGSAMHKADKVPSTCRIYILSNNNNNENTKCKQVKLNKKNNFRFSGDKEQVRVQEHKVPGGLFSMGGSRKTHLCRRRQDRGAELSPA